MDKRQHNLYMDYMDGLLKGCAIKAQSGMLTIGKGMLKFHGLIYLMQEEERVPYRPADGWQSLKAEFTEDESSLDDKVYQGRFFLDNETGLKENQMEMCRFYLREGSVLRDSYKDFADMATEYDTLHLCNAAVAGIGEGRFHPGILKQFAKELWVQKGKEGADIALCYEIWNSKFYMPNSMLLLLLDYPSNENFRKMKYNIPKIDCVPNYK